MKLKAKFQVYRINPFVPVEDKGKPPAYALILVSLYKSMKKNLRTKCPDLPENGGLVKCSIINVEDDTEVCSGTAICSLSDKFSDHIGITISMERARVTMEQLGNATLDMVQIALRDMKY